jgi:hypothetical protein
MLYQGKYKFHFRCYSLLNGKFQSFVYKKSFILTSGLEYSDDIHDQRRHITNLSVNKHFSHHPGQVPCDISVEYPELFRKIQKMWAELCNAAKPFMIYQEDPSHFEFFGFDVIADASGECWLVEVNRLPGLESSKNNLVEEDDLYNEMMTDVLKMVLYPSLLERLSSHSFPSSQLDELQQIYSHIPMGFWTEVTDLAETKDPSEPIYTRAETSKSSQEASSNNNYKNLLKWKMFTRLHRKEILSVNH